MRGSSSLEGFRATSSTMSLTRYPLRLQTECGSRNVDGHRYVDSLLSFGALILGHGHSVVKRAIEEAWDTFGTSSFGVPYPLV